MKSLYSISPITNQSYWQTLFNQVEFPQMTQAWAFGEAKRATGWRPKRFVINKNSRPVAIFQALHRTIAGISLVARINQGPMMLINHSDDALNAHAAVRRRWRFLFRGLLLISPTLEHNDEAIAQMKAMGFRKRVAHGWASSRLDLTRSIDDLRKGLDSKWRNHLKKSESHGLKISISSEPEDVEWLLEKHVENMAQKNFEGPAAALVRGLYKAAPSEFFVLRVTQGDMQVAGMGVSCFNHIGQYYIGWFPDSGRALNAGNFLLWNALVELKKLGCTRFDLGGHHRAVGFGRFKMGMNGTVYASAGEFLCV